jgi:hypothetical protein
LLFAIRLEMVGDMTIPWWKRKGAIAIAIGSAAVAIFAWLFWMIGEAGYNQTVPR